MTERDATTALLARRARREALESHPVEGMYLLLLLLESGDRRWGSS